MKTSEIVKELKKIGCYKVFEGANHERWYSPVTNLEFSVPRHYSKELHPKTAHSIKKQAGLK